MEGEQMEGEHMEGDQMDESGVPGDGEMEENPEGMEGSPEEGGQEDYEAQQQL